MSKQLDMSKSVYQLVKEYPELVDMMKELGFKEITNRIMLNSVGKIMTIPKGAMAKGIPMEKIVAKLMGAGFTLVGAMPSMNGETGQEESPEPQGQETDRVGQLKGYLKRLGQGEGLDSVRSDFAKHFAHVEASEIMAAEQGLMKEGTPLEEVQQLCDLHSALFHGSTIEEQMQGEHQKVEATLEAQEKSRSLPACLAIPGHPLRSLQEENKALHQLLETVISQCKAHSLDQEDWKALGQVASHYEKKGDLLYPHLQAKYDIAGPSMVMWTVDRDLRDQLGKLAKASQHNEAWYQDLEALLIRMEEMIYKEENILFPLCAEHFSQEDWYGIYQDSKDFESVWGLESVSWPEAEEYWVKKKQGGPFMDNGKEIIMAGGHMTLPQLEALLNTLPMEVSFVDAQDKNCFFNSGEKVFKRPSMAIGRSVFSCHPPKIQPIVKGILDSFKDGSRDQVQVWLEKNDRPYLVSYMAVRDKDKNYLGALELVQDMEFAKVHFAK